MVSRAQIGLITTALIPALGLVPAFFNVTNLNWIFKTLIVIGSFAVGLILNYVEVYRPYISVRTNHERALLDVITANLTHVLEDLCPGVSGHRFNVMKVGRKHLFMGTQSLRIRYWRGDYKPSELELEWSSGSGSCGIALARNQPIYFDREAGEERHLNVPAIHKDVTSNIGSILSVPIYRPDSKAPIGILNVDHARGVEYTKFDGEAIQTAVIKAAALIGIVLRV